MLRPVAEPVVGHVQGLVDEAAQVSVTQGVDHPAPLFARVHQPGQPEPRQVLADGRPGRSARLREGRDVGLSPGQGVEEGEAGAVAEQGEDLGGQGELFLAGGARVRIVCS